MVGDFFTIMRALALLILPVALTACQTSRPEPVEIPLTLRTVGPVYADRVIEVTDANKDEKITVEEWTKAGGTKKTFDRIDDNKDGVITRTELIRFGSSTQFLDFTRRYMDVNEDNRLTPRDFRTAPGARLLRIEF